MRILITNDDGNHAEGLKVLAGVAAKFGEVKVVAPDRERSACGHSMTMRDPLRIREVAWSGGQAFEVNGVPVDCVNVGLTLAWPDGCDLVLSGFNHGPNLGYDITYSGTAAGAMEGVINGIRSIALSIAGFDHSAPLQFETAANWLRQEFHSLLGLAVPEGTFLNVNVPSMPFEGLAGQKIVPMSGRVYEDRVELRADPWGRPYYWQGGVAIVDGKDAGSDFAAVQAGFVSVTPVQVDWTNRGILPQLSVAFDKVCFSSV